MRNHIEVDREKSIFSQPLSVILFACRTDRFNEWQMDEVADKAADQEKELESLRAQVKQLEGNIPNLFNQGFEQALNGFIGSMQLMASESKMNKDTGTKVAAECAALFAGKFLEGASPSLRANASTIDPDKESE